MLGNIRINKKDLHFTVSLFYLVSVCESASLSNLKTNIRNKMERLPRKKKKKIRKEAAERLMVICDAIVCRKVIVEFINTPSLIELLPETSISKDVNGKFYEQTFPC